MATPIPLYDIVREHEPVRAELLDGLRRVVDRGRYVLGPELAAFEDELARFLGRGRCLGVKSGTDALHLALRALGVGPGDEVVTTPFTFFATAEAIRLAGAEPVFADIDTDTLCLSPGACEAAIGPRTRAVVLVHLFGHSADLDRFGDLCRARGIHLVEDCCQALGGTWRGQRLGTFGAAAAMSFYPTKNLPALGDGGAVCTGDAGVARGVELLRNHGRDEHGRHTLWGVNSRLDELQSSFLRAGLGRLDAATGRRRQLAARYDRALAGLVAPVRGAPGCESCYHQYGIRTPDRDRLHRCLGDAGIETGRYYLTPLHLEPALGRPGPSLPRAEQASREVLTLPVRPSLTDAEQDRVIEVVRGHLNP